LLYAHAVSSTSQNNP